MMLKKNSTTATRLNATLLGSCNEISVYDKCERAKRVSSRMDFVCTLPDGMTANYILLLATIPQNEYTQNSNYTTQRFKVKTQQLLNHTYRFGWDEK